MHRPTLIAAALASVSTTALASETITYGYDARGRIVQVAHSGSVNNGLLTTYALDKADNRASVTVTGGGSPAPSPTPPPAPAPAPSPPPPSPSPGTNVRACAAVVPLGGTFRAIPCAAPT